MMKTREIVLIDEEKCDGCGQCVPSCAEGALQVIDGKARIVDDSFCDGLGACLGDCPRGAISIEERETAEFDEEAVKKHLAKRDRTDPAPEKLPCGCPGSAMRTIQRDPGAGTDTSHASVPSALRTWPVQMRLVPPTAPFLKNADLLICADCVPFAYGNFHRDFVDGRVVLVGCPKLDDIEYYQTKLTEIFSIAEARSVTVLRMEVPCCTGIVTAVRDALDEAAPGTPLEMKVIGINGEVIREETTGSEACCC